MQVIPENIHVMGIGSEFCDQRRTGVGNVAAGLLAITSILLYVSAISVSDNGHYFKTGPL